MVVLPWRQGLARLPERLRRLLGCPNPDVVAKVLPRPRLTRRGLGDVSDDFAFLFPIRQPGVGDVFDALFVSRDFKNEIAR